METVDRRGIIDDTDKSPTRLEGMETLLVVSIVVRRKWSPTRLEGMETGSGQITPPPLPSLRPALRGWKRKGEEPHEGW